MIRDRAHHQHSQADISRHHHHLAYSRPGGQALPVWYMRPDNDDSSAEGVWGLS